jgi:hydrophobic/amphiphilic exporter-1 (mainly G- bacteria), HAE1 family
MTKALSCCHYCPNSYSNMLTLFAIVLAIGIVVDDAIVMVEGTAKQIEQGKTPKESAILAMG